MALYKANLAKAEAKLVLAKAKLDFAKIKAPFDGIVDRQRQQLGSLIKEGDILTTLSDNSVMWVYFNVTEKYYLEYMAALKQPEKKEDKIELVLANSDTFPQTGTIGAIEADFNNETGNIKFRADFPNPVDKETGYRLLRHGQTGTVLTHRPLKNALVIPQRAVFENLSKRYVYVVGKDDVVHQREIVVQHEMEDIFVIKNGLDVNDRIVLEGVRQVRDGAEGGIRISFSGRGHDQPEVPCRVATASRSETRRYNYKHMFTNILHRPALAIVISVIIVFLGGLAIDTLPISQFPSVAPPSVIVAVSYPGASAEVLVDSVLIILEQAINGVQDMRVHGLRRHQCRRGGDPDHLRAGHGPERGRLEREQPDPDREEQAP